MNQNLIVLDIQVFKAEGGWSLIPNILRKGGEPGMLLMFIHQVLYVALYT